MELGSLNRAIVHYVGNKTTGGVKFSHQLTDFENVSEHISNLITNNFKFDELYKFHFEPNLDLNPTYQFVKSIFGNLEDDFIKESQNIAKYLYEKSSHPQIKGGELCVMYFNDCKYKGDKIDVLGFFKSENKDVFLEIERNNEGFEIESKQGININKLDKGCLVFNLNQEDGYLVSIIDNTNRSNAQYWKDDFLSVQLIKNDYYQTNEFLGITKQFITDKLTTEFEIEKPDQIDFLNRSVEYFKNNDKFDKKEFERKVFDDDSIIDSFEEFDKNYREENDLEDLNIFPISKQAVKKQSRIFKSIIKLDKNFHIYLHGDRQMIEKGIDEDGRKYYKLYYKNET